MDKTAIIYQLVTTGKFYFLSRPRRFGKSLLISTLKSYFEGKKELFKGLAIYDMENDWIPYPVITLSLSAYNPTASNLKDILESQIRQYEEIYCDKVLDTDLSMRFRNLILSAHKKTGQKVVILIDEYDAPMVAHIDDPEKYEEMRNTLKSVYVNLKDMDAYIRFGMLTGITRFSKMTIFSGLNNLDDISLDDRYAEICGITEEELKSNFQIGISRLANALETDFEGALDTLKKNYDGYHFTEKSQDIYNPFSILKCLNTSKIGSYWFTVGTPSFLLKKIQNLKKPLPQALKPTLVEEQLSDIDVAGKSPISLLFQTGYLTIKGYDKEFKEYILGIPNLEVERGLFRDMIAYNTEMNNDDVYGSVSDIRKAFYRGKPEEGLEYVKEFLASIPAYLTQKNSEVYFQNNLFMLFSLVGIDTKTEWWTSVGRIDVVLTTPKYIYVMELKLDKSAKEAMSQIDSKDYTLQFRHDGRQIVKIGINFSKEKRNIDDWIISGG